MKKLILIAAIIYCFAPDLFYGPVDDALILLGSMAYTASGYRNKDKDRDSETMKVYEEYCD